MAKLSKLIKILNRIGRWPLLSLVQTIVIAAGLLGLYFTYVQIHDLRRVNAGQIVLDITRDIYSSERYKNNPDIIRLIERGQPILKANNGPFDDQDLDNLLGEWGLVNTLNQTGVLPDDIVYQTFSFDLVKSFENQEIKTYIDLQRKTYGDQLLYADYENIARWALGSSSDQ